MSHGQLTPEWSTPRLNESNQREYRVGGEVGGTDRFLCSAHAWRPIVPRNKINAAKP